MNAFTKYESVHVRWPGQTSGAFGLALIFLVLFASRQKEQKIKEHIYLCSFFCLCKRILRQAQDKILKEKHTGNDIQPLPDALI